MSKVNNPDYKFYCMVDDMIESGWEYKEDAFDQKAELEDTGFKGKVKVLTKQGLKKFNLDPDNDNDWGNPYRKNENVKIANIFLEEDKPIEEVKVFFENLNADTQVRIMKAILESVNASEDDEYANKKIMEVLSEKPLWITIGDELVRELDIDL